MQGSAKNLSLQAKLSSMRFILFLSVIFLFISCGGDKKPKTIIAEETFVELLVELHMYDAVGTDHTLNELTGDIDSLTLYTSLLHKYNTSKEQFDASIKWYSENPEELSKLYDNVFGKITRISQTWDDDLEMINESENKQLFKLSGYIDTRGDTVSYPKPFLVKIDTAGIILVDLRIRMLKDDGSKNPQIVAYFQKDTTNIKDTLLAIKQRVVKSNFSRDYQYTTELTDTSYKYLKIIIPKVDNDTSSYFKNLQLSSMVISRAQKKENDNK